MQHTHKKQSLYREQLDNANDRALRSGYRRMQGNLSDLVKEYDNALIICLRCALDTTEETKNAEWQTMNYPK